MVQLDWCLHESTLKGALDSYLKWLVRVQPQLAASYGATLERFTERWLDAFLPNDLSALSSSWLRAYLVSSEHPNETGLALNDFFRWAVREGLITRSPLDD